MHITLNILSFFLMLTLVMRVMVQKKYKECLSGLLQMLFKIIFVPKKIILKITKPKKKTSNIQLNFLSVTNFSISII